MKTYQDLMAVGEDEKTRIAFALAAIGEHKTGGDFRIAADAEMYARQKNVTINRCEKYIYSLSGKKVADEYSANHKCASNFFGRFTTQQVQFLLGNGVSFTKEDTKKRLGADFDIQMQRAAKSALLGGCSFGFMNFDHVEVFALTEFVPLWDEETGALRAGIRFWQLDVDKPLRFTLYEEDGYTDYIRRKDKDAEVMNEKRAYTQIERKSGFSGSEIVDGKNYGRFPIVPLWANENRQSELVGIREGIDCYDLIKSGFANDLEDAATFYWTLENCGGMQDKDLAKFIQRIRTVKAAAVDGDEGARATAHTMEVPYNARETALTRLENDLYADYMALNVSNISSASVTATQIEAAYEPLNNKADAWEYQVIEFIKGLIAVIGIEDDPSFTRSKIVNQGEEIEKVLSAAEYFDDEFIVKRICNILGCPDEADDILRRKDAEETKRYEPLEEDGDDDDGGQGA